MPRTWPVVKREFTEVLRSKMFIIGTLFGPLLFVGIMVLEIVMVRSGGGEKSLVLVDATTEQVGQGVARALETPTPAQGPGGKRTIFHVQVAPLGAQDPDAVRSAVQARIDRKEIDGYIWLPANVLENGTAAYVGRSATNMELVARIQASVQDAVQTVRLADQGIDQRRLATALRRVPFETRKAASGAAQGSGTALFFLGYVLGLVIYMVVIIFGAAVMRGVLEEKKDRIVEVVVSSIKAKELMMGKVLGIGGASLLQVAVWVGFAALGLRYGSQLLARFGAAGVTMPQVPGSLGAVFLLYFAGGFFLYSGAYAALGAMAASDQDMQQLQMPVIMVLMFSYLTTMRAMTDPEGTFSRVASWVPFSSPMIMPVRSALTPVSPLEIAGSLLTLVLTALLIIWLGGKIYRVGILATGKRPTMKELATWLRAA